MTKKSKSNDRKTNDRKKSPASSASQVTEAEHAAGPQRPWLVIVLGLVGCLLTIGLTWVKLNQSVLPYCDAGSGCDVVQNSRWSTFLGAPIAMWGLLTYLVITIAAWRSAITSKSWRWVVLFSTIGVAISLYLTAVSVLEIKATCVYCLVSLAVMSAIFLATLMRAERGRFGSWHVGSGVASVAIVALLFLHFSGAFDPAAGPEDPYLKSLAVHLEESGAKFYGAYWCPHCQQQKAAFGASGHRLPYVECTPGGPKGPRDTDCITAEISGYPTWIIDERRIERAIAPAQLAVLSNFKPPAGIETPVPAN